MSASKTLHPLSSEKQKRDTKRASGNEQVVNWFMRYLVNMMKCGLAITVIEVEPKHKDRPRKVTLHVTLGPVAEKQLNNWFAIEPFDDEEEE